MFQKARALHPLPIPKHLSDSVKKLQTEVESKKLLNIMYHDGDYYVAEPFADKVHKRDPDLIIEKHCWLVLKYMPRMRHSIKLNDVVRFGRVTFKVTELVITPDEIEKAAQTIE